MIQRHEIKNKIAEILTEVNTQFEVLQKFDTDINVEILNAKIAYLANFSAILSKISLIEKIEGSFEYSMSEKTNKFDRQVLENKFKSENESNALIESTKEVREAEASFIEEPVLPEPFLIIKDLPVEQAAHHQSVVEEVVVSPSLSSPNTEEKLASVAPTHFTTEVKNEQPELPFETKPLVEKHSIAVVQEELPAEKLNSINELFAQKKQADQESSTNRLSMPIHDLKMAFSLNNKILFIRELFNGYNLAFSEAVDMLNQMKSFNEAKQFLEEHYFVKNQWGTKEDVVQQFYEIIRNRYTA